MAALDVMRQRPLLAGLRIFILSPDAAARLQLIYLVGGTQCASNKHDNWLIHTRHADQTKLTAK